MALAGLASSCAYYNTFYLARKYYLTATAGYPYPVEKAPGAQAGIYQKSIDYSKKLLAEYPKSKWVDDAYLMWARSLLGKGDPLETATMLQDFSTRFPNSPLKNEATFYLGVAYRQGHKYREALVALDEYLDKAPRGDMAAYAHFERSRALLSLARPAEAAAAAGRVIDGFPKSSLATQARAARAEASLAAGDAAGARADYAELGLRARDDDERLAFLMHEADCLELARDYQKELAILGDALSHEVKPVKDPGVAPPTGAAFERYGRLTLRVGTVHLLSGRTDQALASYKNVIQDYPSSPLAAEAQYRIAYAYETVLDDFESARQEYAKVKEQSGNSAFDEQAESRRLSLERLARYRAASGDSAGRDSAGRQVEAGFLLAEQYLFQLSKPERALEAYAAIAHDHPGTPAAGKAINAQAWVLRRKLDRPGSADSLLWTVVREYPATEAQLAARDYLEAAGQQVPDDLIKMPEPQLAARDSVMTPPPEAPAPIAGEGLPGAGQAIASQTDSLPLKTAPSIGPLPPLPGATAGRLRPGGPPPQPFPPSVGPVTAGPTATAPAVGPRAGAARAGGRVLDDPPMPPPDSTETAPRDSSRVPPR